MFWSTHPFPCGSAGCEREICEAELLGKSACVIVWEKNKKREKKKVETVLPCFECILGTGCHFRTSCASLAVLAFRMCFVSPPPSQTVLTKHELSTFRGIREWSRKICKALTIRALGAGTPRATQCCLTQRSVSRASSQIVFETALVATHQLCSPLARHTSKVPLCCRWPFVLPGDSSHI